MITGPPNFTKPRFEPLRETNSDLQALFLLIKKCFSYNRSFVVKIKKVLPVSRLLLFLISLSFFQNCGQSNLLPYKVQKIRFLFHGKSTLSFIEDLDNNAISERIFIEDTKDEEVPWRIMVNDLESGYHIYSEPVWGELKDVKAFDVDNDGQKEILYTYLKNDSMFFKIYNPFNEGEVLFHEKVWVGKRRFSQRPWQGKFKIAGLWDLNHDGEKDLVLIISAGYDRYPRGVLVYDLHKRREMWHYWIGPIVERVLVEDLNKDGHYELYLDNWSPANGAEINQTDDYHSYLIVLNEKGRLLFRQEMGMKNSSTQVFFVSLTPGKSPRLMTLTKTANFNISTGNSLIKWCFRDWPQLFPEVQNTRVIFDAGLAVLNYDFLPHIFLINAEGQLCALDSTLQLVRIFDYNFPLKWYRGQLDLNGDGKLETVWRVAHADSTVILSHRFKLLAKDKGIRFVFPIKSGRTKPLKYAFMYSDYNVFLVKLQRITILDYFKSNHYLLFGLAILLLFLGLALLKHAFSGGWDWYREQLRFFSESFTAMLSLDKKGHIVSMNRQAEKLFHCRFEEVKGESWEKIFTNDFRNLRDWVKEQLKRRKNVQQEIRLTIGEEERVFQVYVQFVFSLLNRNEGVLVLFNDITPLVHSRKTVSWLMVAQKMAHEIKNPLTSIRLSLQRIKYEYEGDSELRNKLEEFVEGSLEEVNRLRQVVDDFMRFSRIQSPRMNLINLREIIEETVQKYRLHLPEAVELKTEFMDENITVYADESQMLTLLTNLLDNAVQATDSPGEISIKLFAAERIQEDPQNPVKKEIVLEIADTGRGMDSETQKRVFDPFFTTREGGSGLGMNIVKRIVEEHQGRIELFSRPGLGTRITIFFPLNNQQVTS